MLNEEAKKQMTHADGEEVFTPVDKKVAKRKADNSKEQKMGREDMGKTKVEEDVDLDDDDLEEGKTFRKDQDDDEYNKNSKMKNRRSASKSKRKDMDDDMEESVEDDETKDEIVESIMPSDEYLDTIVSTIVEFAQSQNEESLQESVKEIDTLFEGEDFPEGFGKKATTIFEAAVNERVNSLTPYLKEALTEAMKETIADAVETINEGLDRYTSYVAESWVEDHQPAIVNRIKMDQYESLVEGLKGVFAEHNISVLDEEDSVEEKLLERIEELEEKNSNLTNSIIEKDEILEEFEKAAALSEVTEGLNLSDADYERLSALTEHLDYDDVSEMKVIVENFFKPNRTIKEDVEVQELNEEVEHISEEKEDNKSIDPIVKWFSANITNPDRR